MASAVTYTIDSINLTTSGVYVESATGLFSIPKRKTPFSVSWAEHNGEVVDLEKPCYEKREITLNCWCSGKTGAEVISKAGAVLATVTTKGLHTLSVTIGTSSYSYQVYAAGDTDIVRSRSGNKIIGKFALKLVEPNPTLFLPNTSNT